VNHPTLCLSKSVGILQPLLEGLRGSGLPKHNGDAKRSIPRQSHWLKLALCLENRATLELAPPLAMWVSAQAP